MYSPFLPQIFAQAHAGNSRPTNYRLAQRYGVHPAIHQEPVVPLQTRLTVASELCLNLWSRWRGSRMEDVVATPVRDVVLH